MEDQVVQSDANPAPPPPEASKPRPGRKPGQPPAVHHVAVPAESLAPIHEVASLTGQKPGDLMSSFREFLATALPGLAVQFATQALADFEERLAAKKAELALPEEVKWEAGTSAKPRLGADGRPVLRGEEAAAGGVA